LPYVHFTEEQIYRANSVDLEQFLRRNGERLIPSGREKRLAGNHSITLRGNAWYDHSAESGGLAIDFVRNYYSLSFPDAVKKLLGGESGIAHEPMRPKTPKTQKPFMLPPAYSDMRRVFGYLLKNRLLDRGVVSQFARDKLVYESCELAGNKQGGQYEHHNAVFVGFDENGVARHAHKRGLCAESSYKGNADGSDPEYSFHRIGSGSRLYVFEAPIDLLSFISIHSKDWQAHSYVALCGVSGQAMIKTLELHPHLQEVALCLDNDRAGIESAARLSGVLAGKGYIHVSALWPTCKDWNEDIKAMRSAAVVPAEQLARNEGQNQCPVMTIG